MTCMTCDVGVIAGGLDLKVSPKHKLGYSVMFSYAPGARLSAPQRSLAVEAPVVGLEMFSEKP